MYGAGPPVLTLTGSTALLVFGRFDRRGVARWSNTDGDANPTAGGQEEQTGRVTMARCPKLFLPRHRLRR